MTFKILSTEFQRMDTLADMIVKTKVPRSEIDDKAFLLQPRLKGAGLSAGNHIRVQCMNEDYTILYHEATFVVVSVKIDERPVMVDDWNERTLKETTYRLERMTEWWTAREHCYSDPATELPAQVLSERRGPGRPRKTDVAA